jgi:hypothetical protein
MMSLAFVTLVAKICIPKLHLSTPTTAPTRWFLTTTENDEGVVVVVNAVHVIHAKDNVSRPRLYRDLLDYILTASINIDDGTVTAPENSDDNSDSDSDSSGDEQDKNVRDAKGRAGALARAAQRRGRQQRASAPDSPTLRLPASGATACPSSTTWGNGVSFFKAGNPVKVSAKEVSLGPSKAKYWRGMDVVVFDKDGNRMHGTIARIFNSPLRFKFKTKEGDLLDDAHDTFTTAQHMLAAAIDKANGDDGDADILRISSKARKMALTTQGPVPNHLTDQMNRQMTPHDFDVLQSLEFMPDDKLPLALGQLSSCKQGVRLH